MKKEFFSCLALIMLTIRISSAFAGHAVSGTITYANSVSTPICYTYVILDEPNGQWYLAATDGIGEFYFPNVDDGTYNLTVACGINWGGCNSTDALLVLRHFANIELLISPFLDAADVNASGYINSADAQLIASRSTGQINYFNAGDWYYEPVSVTVNGADLTGIAVDGLCFGDVNGSYIPSTDFPCGFSPLYDKRDGKFYITTQIDNKCWMAQNLNIGTKINGNVTATNNGTIEKYCFFNDEDYCDTWGGHYQWDEMMQYSTTPGVQGICPAGWHIPTYSEWCSMLTYLDPTVNCNNWGYTGTDIGGILKETDTTNWYPPNTGATNAASFFALGAGSVWVQGQNGLFMDPWSKTTFWTSDHQVNCPPYADGFILFYDSSQIFASTIAKSTANSVRCVKD